MILLYYMQIYTDHIKYLTYGLFAVSISISVSALMHRTYKTGLALTRQFGNVLAVRVAKMHLSLLIVGYVNWDNKKKIIDSFITDNDSRSLQAEVAYLGRSKYFGRALCSVHNLYTTYRVDIRHLWI